MRRRNRTERRQTERLMNNIKEEPKRMFSDEEIDDIFNTSQSIKQMYRNAGLREEVAVLGIGRPRGDKRRGIGVNLYINSADRDIFEWLRGCKTYDIRYKKIEGGYVAFVQADTSSSTISNTESVYPKDRLMLCMLRETFAGIFEGDYGKRLVADAEESYISDNGTVVLVFRT